MFAKLASVTGEFNEGKLKALDFHRKGPGPGEPNATLESPTPFHFVLFWGEGFYLDLGSQYQVPQLPLAFRFYHVWLSLVTYYSGN